MKKTLLTLVLAFCVLAGQGQTSTTASGVNTTELNSKWAQFTQLAEKKQYKQAIDEGVRVSILFTENRQYKEAFATCRQMDALIYTNEQETKKANYPLRYQVTKERLRMYTRLKNAEQCKKQLNQLHTYRKIFSLPRLIITKHSVCRTKASHAIKNCFENVRKEKTKKA